MKTYQAVQPSSEKIHSTHLHPRGGGWDAGRGCQVQIKQISQEVTLGWDDSRRRLRNSSCRTRLWAVHTLPTKEDNKNSSLPSSPFIFIRGHRALTIRRWQEVFCAEHHGCPQRRHWGACGRQRPECQYGR